MNNLTCPICGEPLIKDDLGPFPMRVMDGNTTFHCSGEASHAFWKNARSRGVYCYNPGRVSETNFEYTRSWQLGSVTNDWTEIPKEDPEPEKKYSTLRFDSTGFELSELQALVYKAEDRAKATGVSVAHVFAEAMQSFFDTNK